VGRDTTEPWDTWYPKARAAYKQVTTDSDVHELFEDLSPIPNRKFYTSAEIGTIRTSDNDTYYYFADAAIKNFKEEFGDSDNYLAVLDGGVPVFFLARNSLDLKEIFTGVVYTTSSNVVGNNQTIRAIHSVVEFKRKPLIKRLGWHWFWIVPLILLAAFGSVAYDHALKQGELGQRQNREYYISEQISKRQFAMINQKKNTDLAEAVERRIKKLEEDVEAADKYVDDSSSDLFDLFSGSSKQKAKEDAEEALISFKRKHKGWANDYSTEIWRMPQEERDEIVDPNVVRDILRKEYAEESPITSKAWVVPAGWIASLILGLILSPLLFRTARWGWGNDNVSIQKVRNIVRNPEWRQFIDLSDSMVQAVFSSAFHSSGAGTSRGSRVSNSQTTGQGMPPSDK